MVRSVQRRKRGSVLGAGRSEHDNDYESCVSRPEHSDDRCGHRLLSVIPIVSMRVEGGYAGRCLLCGTTGPVRGDGEAARGVLLDQMVSDEQ
jgi:hypothetical protein